MAKIPSRKFSGDILASSRRKRQKKFLVKGGIFTFVILILIAGIASLFYIKYFRISGISINGISGLNENDLRAEIFASLQGKYLKIIPRDNVFIYPKKEIITGLMRDFPIIKSVSVKRDFPSNISFSIDERKAEAIWCLDRNPAQNSATSTSDALNPDNSAADTAIACAFADKDGFIFGAAPLFSGSIFLKFFDERKDPAAIGKNILSTDEFRKLFLFGNLLLQNNMEVLKIIVKDDGLYEINTSEGWKILMNDKTDANSAFSNLKLVLESNIKEKRPKLDYIDLRFGNKVYFKYK